VKRREFIKLLSGAAVGWSLAASAQTQPKIPRVGCIFVSNPTSNKHLVEVFRQGLRELGYVEGQTIVLELRWAEGRLERIPEVVAELVGLKVDVLVAVTTPAALVAKNATQTIPIVMVAGDPVGLGLVASLARPGGNVTGLSYLTEAIMAKRLQLLKPGSECCVVGGDDHGEAYTTIIRGVGVSRGAELRPPAVGVRLEASEGRRSHRASLAISRLATGKVSHADDDRAGIEPHAGCDSSHDPLGLGVHLSARRAPGLQAAEDVRGRPQNVTRSVTAGF